MKYVDRSEEAKDQLVDELTDQVTDAQKNLIEMLQLVTAFAKAEAGCLSADATDIDNKAHIDLIAESLLLIAALNKLGIGGI